MEIKKVELKECKIDSDFTKVNEDTYSCVSRARVSEKESESIIYLELSKEQYEYINSFNYKELLFSLEGIFEIRKNKKDMPFMFFKVNSIINTMEIKKMIKTKVKNKKNNTKKSLDDIKLLDSRWIEYIPGLKENLIEMKLDKVKIINKIHTTKTILDFSTLPKNKIIVVKRIEDSDEFELILGYKKFAACKLFNLKAKVYITDKTRNEFIKYANDLWTSINENNKVEKNIEK